MAGRRLLRGTIGSSRWKFEAITGRCHDRPAIICVEASVLATPLVQEMPLVADPGAWLARQVCFNACKVVGVIVDDQASGPCCSPASSGLVVGPGVPSVWDRGCDALRCSGPHGTSPLSLPLSFFVAMLTCFSSALH